MRSLVLLVLLLTSSSCTTVYYPNGRKLACVGSDVTGLRIVATGITVEAVEIRNSSIVREHGNNITKTGASVAASGILSLF